VVLPCLRAGIPVLIILVAGALSTGGCAPESRTSSGASADAAPAAGIAVGESAGETLSSLDSLADGGKAAADTFETALAPLRDVEIIARLDGEAVGVYFEEGRRVKGGARLAQLDDRERRATLEVRKAEADRAEFAWKRAGRLWEQKVIAEEQFVAARSEWQIAEAQRERASIEWERCAVRSPIAGVIELRRVQRGQMVKQGDLLFRIGDPDTLRAELLLPESRLGTVRAGQRVRIIPAAGSAARNAVVTRVNPLVDPASGTFRVVIDIDNRSGELHGGVSARVVFEPGAAKPR
jgi:membrane fusion protein, multidrug efflux system